MKKPINYILLFVLIFAGVSCVEDYQDANPPRAKDGPYLSFLQVET